MDKQSAHEFLFDQEYDIVASILCEWENCKGKNKRQSWKLISSSLLIKEWNYNAKTGLVHEKNIQKIQDIIIENYLKIWVNTILFGHTSMNPFGYVSDHLDWNENDNEENFEKFLEDFEWFAIDDKGNWRISDYGLEKIGNLVIELLMTDDYSKKLYWIDRILNVCHQRSDLASWFVDGGSKTLCKLSENPQIIA